MPYIQAFRRYSLHARLHQSQAQKFGTDALAEAQTKNLITRVRARLGLEASEATWRASASLTEGLAKLEAGQRGPLLEELREALRSPESPVGSLSLWLAAGGDAQPCGPEVRCPAGEALTDLLDGHLRASWSSQWSQEPRFLVHAAERAVERGDPARARAWLLLALAAEIPDQAAVDLARDWGWGPGSTVGGLPGRGPVTGADAAGGAFVGGAASLDHLPHLAIATAQLSRVSTWKRGLEACVCCRVEHRA